MFTRGESCPGLPQLFRRDKNKLFKRHAARIRRPSAGFCGVWRRHIMRFVYSGRELPRSAAAFPEAGNFVTRTHRMQLRPVIEILKSIIGTVIGAPSEDS